MKMMDFKDPQKDYEEKEIKNKLDNEHDIFVKEYFDIIKNQ